MVFPSSEIIKSAHSEAILKDSDHKYAQYIKPAIKSWRVYHFHDTSDTALVKQIHSATDNLRLKTDAANLAAFLLRLKQKFPTHYEQIVKTIQLVALFLRILSIEKMSKLFNWNGWKLGTWTRLLKRTFYPMAHYALFV